MLNKKIKLSIFLMLFLLIHIFIGFISVSANEIKDNDYPAILEKINDALLLDDRQIFSEYIENDSLESFLRINHAGKEKLIEEVTLIENYKLNDSYDLLKVEKRYEAKISIIYVLFNKNSMKIEDFTKNKQIFIDLYKENKIENMDLIADVYTYFLSVDEVDSAKEMMSNPDDLQIIYDGKDSNIKYSLRNKYKVNDSNNTLYHYYAEFGLQGSYKYFVLFKKDNIYKVEVNNISSYLYILKDKIEDGNLKEVLDFLYILNYGKENDLKLNPIFLKFNKEIKVDMLVNKNRGIHYYLSYYKIEDNNVSGKPLTDNEIYKNSSIVFSLKNLQHVRMDNSYENLSFTKIIESKRVESEANMFNDRTGTQEENEKPFILIFLLLLVGFIFIAFFTILITGSSSNEENYRHRNDSYSSIHDLTNDLTSVQSLSRERQVNLNQVFENRDNLQRSMPSQRQSNTNNQEDSITTDNDRSTIRQEIEERRTNYEGYRTSLRESSSTTNLYINSLRERPSTNSDYYFNSISGGYGRNLIDVENRENPRGNYTRENYLDRNRRMTQSEQFDELLASIRDTEPTSNKKEELTIVESLTKNTNRIITIEEESLKKEESVTINTKRQIYFDEEE